MADDPHGRRLLAGHGILADKGETAQPPSAESTPKVPNYGIPDDLDRRTRRLLVPYDFDAGNDGFEAQQLVTPSQTTPIQRFGKTRETCRRHAP